MIKNLRLQLIIFFVLFLGGYCSALGQNAKLFDKMVDTTKYRCYCSSELIDTSFNKEIIFLNDEEVPNQYYINFLIPYSRFDTLLFENKKVYIKNSQSGKNSNLIFDFSEDYAKIDHFIYSYSGLGIWVSFDSKTDSKYTYNFKGISAHSSYISRVKVSQSAGILTFNWYNGDILFTCKKISRN